MTGSLTIHPEERRATFQPEAAPALVLDEITAVSIGGRGTDFANTWVEVHFGHVPEQRVAYINDARFLGWAAIFTGSNRRLASALAGLVEPPGHIA